MSVKRARMKKYHSSEKSSSSSSSETSSDEETDARDLKSIKEYLSDRKQLASQLFKSVKPEKIRMMLPQTLKKIDLKELEELCASELSGMSKKRIISIINAQQMLESSDTNESDDSGPSLEIISDTEEWLSDDTDKKEPNSKSKKAMKSKQKHNNEKVKTKIKTEPKEKNKSKVKEEEVKESTKEKEGDSLLDLLELEMRARAIRALIRKEEDIIPTTSDGQGKTSNANDLDNKISAVKQRVINEINTQQLENIINKQTEEEDVVLVVQPTPIIELLSSDDETEKGNEKESQLKVQDSLEKSINVSKKSSNSNEASTSGNKKDEELNISHTKIKEKSKIVKELTKEKKKKINGSKREKVKKLKRKSGSDINHSSEKEVIEESEKTVKQNTDILDKLNSNGIENTTIEKSCGVNLEERMIDNLINKKDEKYKCTSETEGKIIDNDLEEIIDLDDYPDNMDDMEDEIPLTKSSHEKVSNETWASRYYKTDDVQNVIKESKIQSEIRKRLRERQRLGKINKSPINVEKMEVNVKSQTKEFNPIGSVQEYLALKATISVDSNDDTQNSYECVEQLPNEKGDTNHLNKNESAPIVPNDENVSITYEENKNNIPKESKNDNKEINSNENDEDSTMEEVYKCVENVINSVQETNKSTNKIDVETDVHIITDN